MKKTVAPFVFILVFLTALGGLTRGVFAMPEAADGQPAPEAAESAEALDQRAKDLEEQNRKLEEERKALEAQRKAAEAEQSLSRQNLNSANSQISGVQGEQSALNEELDEANTELLGVMTNVELIEGEIADISGRIVVAQIQYDTAKQQEEALYAAMKERAKYMYEQGDVTYLNILLESQSYADMLNKADYAESLYAYDRKQLDQYIATKTAADLYRAELEDEKSELETAEYELEQEQGYLNALIADYRAQVADYDVQLTRLRQSAAAYSAQLRQQTSTINALTDQISAKNAEREANEKALEEAKRQRQELEPQINEDPAPGSPDAPASVESASATASTATTSSSGSGGGSLSGYNPPGALSGANVAAYAKQFIGNPYVAGGTSLTNGADCSGFVYSVYKAFGITLPRTSWTQRNAGTGVDYANAQPGDLICYAGHVGIYIGNGQIVHASSARTGIKISNATYRTIVAVRRII